MYCRNEVEMKQMVDKLDVRNGEMHELLIALTKFIEAIQVSLLCVGLGGSPCETCAYTWCLSIVAT